MSTRLRNICSRPSGLLALVALVLLLLLAVVAPILWGDAADRTDVVARAQGSSSEHLLGTDDLGRDVLLRVLVAARLSLLLALAAAGISFALGVLLGALPTILPWTRRAVGMLIDLSLAFPAILVAIFLAVILGAGSTSAVLAIGVAGAPQFARLTQTLSASVAQSDYVASARTLGLGSGTVFRRHVLPNIAEPLVLTLTVVLGQSLVALASISFLGIGVQPPSYDWGALLNTGLSRIYVTPWAGLAPGIAITVAGLAFNFFGDTLAATRMGRRPEPKQPARRARAAAAPSGAAASGAAEASGAPDGDVARVDGLRVTVPGAQRPVALVDGVGFAIGAGERVGIVGESGSGKSMTALSLAKLIAPPVAVEADELSFAGRDLIGTSERRLRELLGGSMSVVFQDPMSSLNPSLTVGRQVAEVAEIHGQASRREAWQQAVQRLEAVRIEDAEGRARAYPHELSGGMRQRVMIATGLMRRPQLIIADEPTTALDVTVQQEILEILRNVNEHRGTAILFISHDIALLATLCERVIVMYAGRVVEELPTERLLDGAAHPYTRALVSSVPHLDTDREQPLATIPGRPPRPEERGDGCPFAARCPRVEERCRREMPAAEPLAADHRVACWEPVA